MTLFISSVQNARIKALVKLRQRRVRDTERVTAVEGLRELTLALKQGYRPDELFVCPELVDQQQFNQLLGQFQLTSAPIYEVTAVVYNKIAYRGESEGVVAVFPYWACRLDTLKLPNDPLLAVVENVEKPGNLGAIFRTADAAGVDAIIVCTDGETSMTDVHNPNVIRASLGAVFTVPVAFAQTDRAIDWLQKHQISIIVATPEAKRPFTQTNLKQPVALVTGSEAFGISEHFLQAADFQVCIPMRGQVDSLNLSISTGLLIYEAVRQRTELSIQ